MTKTKKQLRAEAVERLRSIPNEYMNATSVVVAIAGEAAYRLGGTRDARDMCIDLLTDDDSIIQEVESTIELLSDGADSREKLEADVIGFANSFLREHNGAISWNDELRIGILELLDRQAAITANELTSQFDVPKSGKTTENSTAKDEIRDFDDTREKLEADVLKYYTHTVSTAMWPPSANKHTDMVSVSMDMVLEWLDRQAAITRRECDKPNWDYCETCELTAEHDQTINAINELQKKQPYCYNPEQPLDTLNTIGRYINELTAERDELRDELAATKKHLKVAQGQLSVTLNNWEQAKGNLRRQKEALALRAAKLDERDAKTADEIAAEEIDRWKAKAEKARDDAETWRKACGDVLDAADEIHRIMSFHFPSGVR